CAAERLAELAAALPLGVRSIALRACPPLPPTLAERLASYTAQNVADSVMYREALAKAAVPRGWSVHWSEVRRVMARAASALGRRSIDDWLDAIGAEHGRPWTKDHRLAMAAAIAATAPAPGARGA